VAPLRFLPLRQGPHDGPHMAMPHPDSPLGRASGVDHPARQVGRAFVVMTPGPVARDRRPSVHPSNDQVGKRNPVTSGAEFAAIVDKQARRLDPGPWERLYRQAYPGLLAYASRRTGSRPSRRGFRLGDVLHLTDSGPAIMAELDKRGLAGRQPFNVLYTLHRCVGIIWRKGRPTMLAGDMGVRRPIRRGAIFVSSESVGTNICVLTMSSRRSTSER